MSSPEASPVPLPVADLHERVGLGLARGASLLSPEERDVVDRMLAVEGPAALLHARLCGRRPGAFRLPELEAAGVEDVAAAASELVARGLASTDVPWPTRLAEASVAVLAAGCGRLGLPARGRKDTLREALDGREAWDDAAWLVLPHRPLVVRLERWATLQVAPDRAGQVLERMGRLRFVPYALTDGGAIVPSREDWLAWEAVADRVEALTVDEALAALDRAAWPPGGLDLRGELAWHLGELARGLERDGALDAAEAVYDALYARGRRGEVAVRRARVRELAGDAAGALGRLREAHEEATGPDRVALARAGRRVAKALGGAWSPDPPLRRPDVRSIALSRQAGDAARPRYGSGALTVEDAVAARLAEAGRRAIAGEGTLWRTVLSLLLADALFLPVPGQLPVPRLPGPLDAGTPSFAARRAAAVWAVIDAVRAGEAPARVAEAHARFADHVVTGVDVARASAAELAALVEGLGPDGLLAILRPLLAEGRRAAAGLPDLAVLPGPEARVEGLHPSRLHAGVVLVEVKGENDSERDAQRVWFDRLIDAGVRVEVWRVSGGV